MFAAGCSDGPLESLAQGNKIALGPAQMFVAGCSYGPLESLAQPDKIALGVAKMFAAECSDRPLDSLAQADKIAPGAAQRFVAKCSDRPLEPQPRQGPAARQPRFFLLLQRDGRLCARHAQARPAKEQQLSPLILENDNPARQAAQVSPLVAATRRWAHTSP